MSLESTLPLHAARLTGPQRRSLKKATTVPGLMMSDYWFLAGLMLALFFVVDPFLWHLDKISVTKHLPLLVSLYGVMLANVGNWLFRPLKPAPVRYWQILKSGLPLILLGVWIVAGSLYARKYHGINNTFITVGLYMLFTFLAARILMLSPARASIVRAYLLATACCGVFMVLRMAISFDERNVSYHELEALIIPLAVYFALRPAAARIGNRAWHAFMTLFFLVAALVFRKNTGFLVLVLTLSYIWIAEWRFRFRENLSFRFWTALWLVIMLVAGIATMGYLAEQRGELMPSGNPQYRLKTYDVAIERFQESPAWGTSFTAPATEKFTAYAINSAHGILATHSDILDLAAQGGILALSLWVWGYLRISAVSMRYALHGPRPRDDLRAAAHALACMSMASIVVYAFNPILLQPAKAFLMWSQLGMLLGVSLHLANQSVIPAAASGAVHNKAVPNPAIHAGAKNA